MNDRPLVENQPAASPAPEALLKYLTPCDQTALCRLRRAFDELRPVSMLISESRSRSAQVLDEFLADMDSNVDVVRIATPCRDATSCMSEVIRLIGFDPKDLSLTDLENILRMFLSFQRTHGRRTIFCLEGAENCNSWVFHKVTELVRLQVADSLGLFIILAGRPPLADALYRQPFEAVAGHAGSQINVSPLSPSETREFVRQRLEFESVDDPRELIDYEAITELHRITAGIPGKVNGLCIKSLELARKESVYPITADLVCRAGGVADGVDVLSDDTDETEDTVELCIETAEPAIEKASGSDRLVVRLNGVAYSEHRIEGASASIGRSPQSDVCVASLKVSRNHAVIMASSGGAKLMDLGSTNGSFVNGLRIESCALKHGDRIVIGDCQIEYLRADGGLEVLKSGLPGSSKKDHVIQERERLLASCEARTDSRADLRLASVNSSTELPGRVDVLARKRDSLG